METNVDKNERKMKHLHFVLQIKYLLITVLTDDRTNVRLLAHQICSVVNNLTLLSKLLDLWGGKALYKYLYLFTCNF